MLRRRKIEAEGREKARSRFLEDGEVEIFLAADFFNKQLDLQQTKGYSFSHLKCFFALHHHMN